MKDYEVPRLLQVYHDLLAIYEPPEAVKWLVTKQRLLDDRLPCLLLGERTDFHRLQALVKGLINEKKRAWLKKADA